MCLMADVLWCPMIIEEKPGDGGDERRIFGVSDRDTATRLVTRCATIVGSFPISLIAFADGVCAPLSKTMRDVYKLWDESE